MNTKSTISQALCKVLGVLLLVLLAMPAQAFAQDQARRANPAPLSYEQLNAASATFISNPAGTDAASKAATVEVVTDGSFETGSPNAAWNEFSTNFGTPLCTIAFCGTGTGTGPHSGDWWAWFGGISTFEEGSVSQNVTMPVGIATLTFWLEQIVCDSGADYLEVLIDGTQVFVTDGSSPLCGNLGYTQQTVDVTAFADGGTHTLEFHSEIFAVNEGGSNFFVDDVSLLVDDPPVDLELAKVCEVSEDHTASFHIDLYNAGPGDATGVHVQEWLPTPITITGWSATQGTFDPFSGLWDAGALSNGATASLWIDATLGGTGTYENHAEVVAANEPDADSSPNDGAGDDYDGCSFLVLGDRVVPDFVPEGGPGGIVDRGSRFVADLALDKSVDNDAPAVGNEITYTLALVNQGPHSTAKVEVTDVLPACLTFVSATASRGTYDEASGLWDVGKLKVGDTATLEITVEVGATCSGTVTNTAEVTGSSLPDPDDQFNLFDENPVEDEVDSVDITVQAAQARVLDGSRIALGVSYPNPFNPQTTVPFSVVEASRVKLAVYDLLGREVAVLVDGTVSAGVHEVVFEAGQLPTGVYLVRLEASGVVQTHRITLMK